ncbi:MAG TPA: GNAT family N-acetyltransferase [Pseudonocardiaceae bacterium]|nr:GNAT family N-acetyltransferase [Pseudonocardiaceae bacterium]
MIRDIAPAHPSDAQRVIALYHEAITWLAAQDSDQWQHMPGFEARIAADIAAGEVWVVRNDNDVPVATIKLDSRADPELWRPEDDPTSALYAHRMLVARSEAGQHIGSAMLDWASRRAAEATKRWLRLDAWARNEKLHEYYLAEGFELVRLLRFAHRGSGALFQRPAGVELRHGPELVTKTA